MQKGTDVIGRAVVVATAACVVLLPPTLWAQDGTSIGGVTSAVRLGTLSENESQTGRWTGVDGHFRWGHFTVGGRILAGGLGGNPSRQDSDIRRSEISIRLRPRPWLHVGVQAEALRVSNDLVRSIGRMFGVGAAVKSGLGVPGLSATGAIAVYPITSVVASRSLARPRSLEVGMAYRVAGVPFEGHLSYLMETVDYKGASDLRIGGTTLGLRLLR